MNDDTHKLGEITPLPESVETFFVKGADGELRTNKTCKYRTFDECHDGAGGHFTDWVCVGWDFQEICCPGNCPILFKREGTRVDKEAL